MDVASILEPRSVRCDARAASKKLALDVLSEMLAAAAGGDVSAGDVLEGLVTRERLGSTALGRSVAMPHARVPGLARAVAAFIKLSQPVEFDAPDGQPVGLLFGLLVPAEEKPSTLKALRELVRKLCDPALQQALRSSDEPEVIYDLLTDGLKAGRRTMNA